MQEPVQIKLCRLHKFKILFRKLTHILLKMLIKLQELLKMPLMVL